MVRRNTKTAVTVAPARSSPHLRSTFVPHALESDNGADAHRESLAKHPWSPCQPSTHHHIPFDTGTRVIHERSSLNERRAGGGVDTTEDGSDGCARPRFTPSPFIHSRCSRVHSALSSLPLQCTHRRADPPTRKRAADLTGGESTTRSRAAEELRC